MPKEQITTATGMRSPKAQDKKIISPDMTGPDLVNFIYEQDAPVSYKVSVSSIALVEADGGIK
jgi:hypothetical protein